MKKIIVLVGGSGSGKSTIAVELEKRGFHRLVTTTTRPIRKGEVNHADYHFVSKEEFWGIGKVEYNKYVQNYYGLSKLEVESKMKKHDNLVIVMDVNGAKAMKRVYGDIVQVVFLTISPVEMEKRLRQRGGNEIHVQERLQQAYEYQEFTKPKVADAEINNEDLEKTLEQILDLTKKEAY
jgi:guanylate kinase